MKLEVRQLTIKNKSELPAYDIPGQSTCSVTVEIIKVYHLKSKWAGVRGG